jgi:RES domain-containing protein
MPPRRPTPAAASTGSGGPAAFARAIARAPLTDVDGILCRAVAERYLRGPTPQPLYFQGSADHGGRYTPKGGPAGLYLADHPRTAFAEIRHLGFPLELHEPVTLVYVRVRVSALLDLRQPAIRRRLRVRRGDLTGEWADEQVAYLAGGGAPMPLTQAIGAAAHLAGDIRGILYPSARLRGTTCLVVFPDRLRHGDVVESHDSAGRLRQRLP